jgi:hypothetical protein
MAASTETTKPIKKPTDFIEVRNISAVTINLSKGQIDPQDVGLATPAEVSNLYAYIVPV